MVHDCYFSAYRARPFPTVTPAGEQHVGQDEYATNAVDQAAALLRYSGRVPALGIRTE